MRLILALLFLILSFYNQAQNGKSEFIQMDSNRVGVESIKLVHDISMFPKIENMTKRVIFLDELSNENHTKIEVYAIKNAEVDQCNQHKLLGNFEKKNLEGCGYNYYVFNSNGLIISTKMGCMDEVKTKKNIESSHKELIDYNSKIPIVIYAPAGIAIKYRLWNLDVKERESIVYE